MTLRLLQHRSDSGERAVIAAQGDAAHFVPGFASIRALALHAIAQGVSLTAAVEGHLAANDDFFPPEAITALGDDLRKAGRDVVFHVYEGTGHGFANEENPLGTWDEAAAATAWGRTVDFLRSRL